MTALVVQGDAAHLPLPGATVDLIVTSPPYFGLRSYTDGGAHMAEQIGAEPTPTEYLDALITCTREWMRVLNPSGSIFVNIGDKYSTGRVTWSPGKSLLGLPWRYAIRAIDELGLILRAEIIWAKPNGLPESVTDRVRRQHEQVFHLVKQPRYFSGINEIREEVASNYHDRPQYKRAMELFRGAGFSAKHMAAVRSVGVVDSKAGQVRSGGSWDSESGQLAAEVHAVLGSYYRELCGSNTGPALGKLPGSVWSIPTSPLKVPAELGVDHFAAYPPELVRRIVLGWSPPGGVIVDPFGGTGTTALVADVHGRTGISVDLSHDYSRVAVWRTTDEKQRAKAAKAKPSVAVPVVELPCTPTLFDDEAAS